MDDDTIAVRSVWYNEIRRCAVCGSSTADQRTDAKYCSASCRGVARRRREARASTSLLVVVDMHDIVDEDSIDPSVAWIFADDQRRFSHLPKTHRGNGGASATKRPWRRGDYV